MRQRRARLKATVERLSEATPHLRNAGDMVLVSRGVDRLLVFKCPDGCGETVPVNLDPRAGPAWRLYNRSANSTLYPSVWRTEGCRAHFILWDDRIYWTGADRFDEAVDDALVAAVGGVLPSRDYMSFAAVAEVLGEIPWAVLVACERLVRLGVAEEGRDRARSSFRRRG